MGERGRASLFVFRWEKGGNRGRAAASSIQPQQPNDNDCARWGQAVEVGEILQDEELLRQRQTTDGEIAVRAGFDACGVGAEAGSAASIYQQLGGFEAEDGEVQAVIGMCVGVRAEI